MNVSFLQAQFERVVWSGSHLALTLGDLLLAALLVVGGGLVSALAARLAEVLV